MKCLRCNGEIPGQAQFCMQCGAPVTTGRPNSTVMMASRPFDASGGSRTNKKLIAGIAAALVLAAVGIFFAVRAARSSVTEKRGNTLATAPLTDAGGKLKPTSPLPQMVSRPVPGTPEPTDVIEYLKFLKEIERERITLANRHKARVLPMMNVLQAGNLTAEMGDNPDQQHQKDYESIQRSIAEITQDWQILARKFAAHPAPQSCAALKDAYYNMLGKVAGSIIQVFTAFGQAMSGNRDAALSTLTTLLGSASSEIRAACDAADSALASVCNQYKLHKDFDIKDDPGSNLF